VPGLGFQISRPAAFLAEDLAAIHIRCWQQTYGAIVPCHILARTSLAEQTAKWQIILADPSRIVFFASTHEGELAGFIVAGKPTEELFDGIDGHIAALYILPAFQRRGLGRRLLGAVAQDWIARGGKSLALGVLAQNQPARLFYESLAARLVRTGTYEWDGFPLDDAIYVFENLAEIAEGLLLQITP